MTNSATKGLLDKEIMNVFEEREDQFSFPITTERDARDFVKLLNKHGCSYDVISKEVDEDEERFRDWRLGGGSVEIGKHVIERINRPFRDTMFSESENDERRGSLNDFYQFSFDEEEVFTSKSPEIKILRNIESAKGTDSSNLPSDKSKSNLSPIHSSQSNVSSPARETVTSEHESLTTPTTKVDPTKCSPQAIPQASPTPSNQAEKKKNIEMPPNDQKTRPKSPVSRGGEPRQTTIQNQENLTRSTSSALQGTSDTQKNSASSSVQKTLVKDEGEPLQSSSLKDSTNSSQIPPLRQSTQSFTPSKSDSEPTEGERPPSPVTTSPHYQPFVASFTADQLEPMINYNSDDQMEKPDDRGFIYVFCDIPSPSMKMSKHTKFRVRIGTSKDPVKRLQQAILFNPDIRMLASIPVESRVSCKSVLRECLKPMQMKNKLDWYWATLNSIFNAIDIALNKCR